MNALEMKKRFHAAKAELGTAWNEPRLVKAQADYDALRKQEADLRAKVKDAGAKLNDLKKPCADLQEEMALLCRALGGQTALEG
jgi:hypothetical protein